jgi:hypothetical protein
VPTPNKIYLRLDFIPSSRPQVVVQDEVLWNFFLNLVSLFEDPHLETIGGWRVPLFVGERWKKLGRTDHPIQRNHKSQCNASKDYRCITRHHEKGQIRNADLFR